VFTLSVNGSNEYVLDRFSAPYTANMTPDMTMTFPIGSGSVDLAAPNSNGAIHDWVAVDPSGTIYVSDAGNQRVIELDSNFDVLSPTLTGFTGYPGPVATGSVGGATQVYVGDDWGSGAFVRRYNPAGTELASLAVDGAHGGVVQDANGNVFDSEGDSGGAVLRIDTTPDPAIVATPSTGLTSQRVSVDGATSETDLWGVADYSWDLDDSGMFSTDTGTNPSASQQFNTAGTYPIGLQVTGTNGRVASTTVNYVVGNSKAAFTSPTQALTNTAITFDASPSVIPYSTVTDYAWDFDGSGSYAVDGGTSPTITHTFAAPGTYRVQLRVTRAGGRVDTASEQIVAAPVPPPGPVGVLIDNGDYATNNPQVKIGLVWPAGAGQVFISDNGGFGASGNAMAFPLAAEIPWTLEQTGADRLPKTVYVRFLGAGIDDINFTDDIILDETAPTVQYAQLVDAAGSGAGASTARARLHSYRVKVKAQDKIVGVCAVAASGRKAGGSVVRVRNCRKKGILNLAKTVRIVSGTPPKYVRVRNSAGSWSRWRKVSR
jgi:PKD repeat protein